MPSPTPSPGQHRPPSRRRRGLSAAEPAAVSSPNYHGGYPRPPTSAGPSRRPAATSGLSRVQGSHESKADDGLHTSRDGPGACQYHHFALLVGALSVATAAALIAFFLPPASPVNVPISTLGPDNVVIKAGPSPLDHVAAVAEAFVNVTDDVYFPHRSPSDITLTLDAPGLAPVNVASWLPGGWFDPRWKWTGYNKTRGMPADKAPFVVDIANVSVTLRMLNTLWPVLAYAATDLLVSGLGRQHPEYAPLRSPLLPLLHPPAGYRSPVSCARKAWALTRGRVRDWPGEAWGTLLGGPAGHLEQYVAAAAVAARAESAAAQSQSSNDTPSLLAIGSRVPTFEQLLEHDRGRQQTLPQLLANLAISNDALAQVRGVKRELTAAAWDWDLGEYHQTEPSGVGMQDTHDLCAADDLVDALAAAADGRCRPNETDRHRPPLMSKRDYTDRHHIGALWNKLCDAEAFLLSVETLAEQVRSRVRAAVEERGGISWREILAGHFRDGIVRRTAALDRALQILHHLLPALRLQRRMLAAMATRMRHACVLQDRLRDRFYALAIDQTAWWHLEWDGHGVNGTAVVTFVTFPAPQDAITQLDAARDRMMELDEWGKFDWHMSNAAVQLPNKVLAGWVQRVGLGGLPRSKGVHPDDPEYPEHYRIRAFVY